MCDKNGAAEWQGSELLVHVIRLWKAESAVLHLAEGVWRRNSRELRTKRHKKTDTEILYLEKGIEEHLAHSGESLGK